MHLARRGLPAKTTAAQWAHHRVRASPHRYLLCPCTDPCHLLPSPSILLSIGAPPDRKFPGALSRQRSQGSDSIAASRSSSCFVTNKTGQDLQSCDRLRRFLPQNLSGTLQHACTPGLCPHCRRVVAVVKAQVWVTKSIVILCWKVLGLHTGAARVKPRQAKLVPARIASQAFLRKGQADATWIAWMRRMEGDSLFSSRRTIFFFLNLDAICSAAHVQRAASLTHSSAGRSVARRADLCRGIDDLADLGPYSGGHPCHACAATHCSRVSTDCGCTPSRPQAAQRGASASPGATDARCGSSRARAAAGAVRCTRPFKGGPAPMLADHYHRRRRRPTRRCVGPGLG